MKPKFSKNTLLFIQKASKQKKAEWLEKNREEYEEVLANPLQQLTVYLKEKLEPLAPGYHFPTKGVGRIKRNANRIDETGSVFKDWIAFSASRPRQSRFEMNPNLYFEIDPNDADGDQVIVAGGLYMPSSQQMRAIRHAIANDGSDFQALFASKAFKDCFKGGFSKDRTSTRVPRGFDANHPRMDWIKLQAFFVWRAYKMKEFSSPKFPELVAKDMKQVLRMNELLERAIHGKSSPQAPKKKSQKLTSELDSIEVTVRKMDF